jgi:hypothetical protein
VLDVQTSLLCEFVSHPAVIENVPRLGSVRTVVDRVEGNVRAREEVELQLRVGLPRARGSPSRPGPKGTPEAKYLRVADATVQMHIARLDLRLRVDRNASGQRVRSCT